MDQPEQQTFVPNGTRTMLLADAVATRVPFHKGAFEWVNALGHQILAHTDAQTGQHLWQVFQREASGLIRLLRTLPESHHAKALALFGEVIVNSEARPRLARDVRRLQILARFFCRPPFSSDNQPGAALLALCHLPGRSWHDLLNMHIKTRLKFDQFCERRTSVRILAKGLAELAQREPRFTVVSLDQDPGLFLNAVFALAALPANQQQLVFEAWQQHPLVLLHATGLTLAQLASAMEQHLVKGIKNPIPKKLKAYLGGEIVLTPGQLDRMQAVLTRNLRLAQIELLRVLSRRQSLKM